MYYVLRVMYSFRMSVNDRQYIFLSRESFTGNIRSLLLQYFQWQGILDLKIKKELCKEPLSVAILYFTRMSFPSAFEFRFFSWTVNRKKRKKGLVRGQR